MPCEHCPHCRKIEEEKRAVELLLAEQATAAAAAQTFDVKTIRPILSPDKRLSRKEEVQPLRDDQNAIAMNIINKQHENRLHVIDGIAGVGKTYFLVQLGAMIRNLKLRVEHVSYSEFGSPHGKTLRNLMSYSFEQMSAIDVILIDNANRIPVDQVIQLSDKLKRIMKSTYLFGGKTVVLAVDFGMPPPYCEQFDRKSELSVKSFVSDEKFIRHHLKTSDNQWDQWLEEIRASPKMILPEKNIVKTMDDLIQFVYGHLYRQEPHRGGILLAPRKIHVNELNREVLDRLAGELEVFEAQFDDNIIRSDLDLHEIKLKKNCIVSLEQPCKGLPVGTRLLYIDSEKHFLICTVLDGPRTGEQVDIPRIRRHLAAATHESQQTVQQFPIAVCFAATIHSAQGRRYEKVGLYKLEESFEHGMVYCALSRTESSFRVRVLTEDPVIPTKLDSKLIDF